MWPIAYASRSLRPTECNMSNYSSMKLEFLALKWAMTEKFREYLLGQRCVVFTDNNPLSHLNTAKLGATKQRWAAQLAAFDFELRYCSGRSNRNVNALSCQGSSSQGELEQLLPGTALPAMVRQAGVTGVGSQAAVTVLPGLAVDIQREDPVIGETLRFWRRGEPPSAEERLQLPRAVLSLVQQWSHLCEQDGVLHRRVFRSDGGDEILQVVLPSLLHHEVLTLLHQEHGHQGVERTTGLV